MKGYNFTERVRKVLALARDEAEHLRHEYVGTEHMLLGLIREGEGAGAAVLRNLGVDPTEIRRKVFEILQRGRQTPTGPDLPYTSRAKKALELSMGEAAGLNHDYVGTEHLLLGLLREEKGIAAQVLNAAGVTIDVARIEVLRLVGQLKPEGSSTGDRWLYVKGPAIKSVEVRSYNLKKGARAEFHRTMVAEVTPMLREWGMDVVSYGPSPHDDDSYYLIRAYSSLGDRATSQEGFYGSDEWRNGPRERILAAIESYTNIVIELDAETLNSLRTP